MDNRYSNQHSISRETTGLDSHRSEDFFRTAEVGILRYEKDLEEAANTPLIEFQELREISGDVIGYLIDSLGEKLTAYMIKEPDPAILREYQADPSAISEEAAERLFAAHEIFARLSEYEGCEVARSWFIGMKDSLGDEAPASFIRDSDIQEFRRGYHSILLPSLGSVLTDGFE